MSLCSALKFGFPLLPPGDSSAAKYMSSASGFTSAVDAEAGGMNCAGNSSYYFVLSVHTMVTLIPKKKSSF